MFATTGVSIYAQEVDNEFTIDAKLSTRGEIRAGGFDADSNSGNAMAHFVTGQYRINFGYKRSWLEVKISPQASCVWGSSSVNLGLAEGWVALESKKRFF